MNKPKIDIISELKQFKNLYYPLEELNNKYMKELEILRKENKNLKKEHELDNFIAKNFYDVIIDIKSIESLNREGWAIEMTEKGEKKYLDYKDEVNSIRIGVIGNTNKGKSFLLSKISKIKLLSGTSIQTKGLSIKYPDVENYSKRRIILLDSAGLETPVLKKDFRENQEEKDKQKEELKNEEENEYNIQENYIEPEKFLIDKKE